MAAVAPAHQRLAGEEFRRGWISHKVAGFVFRLAKGWCGFVALKVANTRNGRFFARGRGKTPTGKQGFSS